MSEKIKNFLVGFGSIFDLCPVISYDEFLIKKSDEELMRENFQLVGDSLTSAIDTYRNEQGKQAQATRHQYN